VHRSIPLPSVELLDPRRYASEGYPHADWARLRRESPVHWCSRDEGESFWALTRHAEIVHVSQRPLQYLNAPRLAMSYDPSITAEDFGLRMLLNLDPPEHRDYRSLISQRFTPRALQSIRKRVDGIADDILDRVMERGAHGETDFVATVSALLPIWVIAEMLGVPRSDWELLFDWTNRTIGAADPEYRDEGSSPKETIDAARMSLFHYFDDMTKDRRKNPSDDLVSLLANAKVNGEELPPFELLSYYLLLVIAGNETTRNATSGGVLALIENPDELEKVRTNPTLIKPLVEEVLRWTSPVIHFCRTAAEDVELVDQ
jgi:cholest-4-en-3-one 26-monooxygenase